MASADRWLLGWVLQPRTALVTPPGLGLPLPDDSRTTAPAAGTAPPTAFKGGRRDDTPPHIPSSIGRTEPVQEPPQHPLWSHRPDLARLATPGCKGTQESSVLPHTRNLAVPSTNPNLPMTPNSSGRDHGVPSCIPQGPLIQRPFQSHPHHFPVTCRQQGPPDPGSWRRRISGPQGKAASHPLTMTTMETGAHCHQDRPGNRRADPAAPSGHH